MALINLIFQMLETNYIFVVCQCTSDPLAVNCMETNNKKIGGSPKMVNVIFVCDIELGYLLWNKARNKDSKKCGFYQRM